MLDFVVLAVRNNGHAIVIYVDPPVIFELIYSTIYQFQHKYGSNNTTDVVRTLTGRGRRGRGRMIVGLTTTYAISAYHL